MRNFFLWELKCLKVNRKNSYVNSISEVLNNAVKNHNLQAIQIFLSHGISVNSCIKGVSLLLTALLSNGETKLSSYLLSQGAKIIDDGNFTVCKDLMLNKFHNGLSKAIELGYSLHKRDTCGSNYLHFACLDNDLNIVKQILQSKYKDELLHEKNSNSDTPFLLAARHAVLIDMLLDAGANINDQDNTGKTALLHHCISRDKTVFDILMKRNVDVNLADNNGWVRYLL